MKGLVNGQETRLAHRDFKLLDLGKHRAVKPGLEIKMLENMSEKTYTTFSDDQNGTRFLFFSEQKNSHFKHFIQSGF